MKKWEYIVVAGLMFTDSTTKKLNALGEEGWELVTAAGALYTLKRERE
jgi:hypothetical protein